jgi:hypothetical protein
MKLKACFSVNNEPQFCQIVDDIESGERFEAAMEDRLEGENRPKVGDTVTMTATIMEADGDEEDEYEDDDYLD